MMKMTILRFGWALALLALAATVGAVPEPAVPLTPTTEQRYTTRLATRFLTNYHYQSHELDDELSERVFEQYIRLLDPNRVYFLASDIEQLDRYRLRLDDALRTAEIEPAYEIFSLYQRRVEQRIEYARALLQDDVSFDFSIDEDYRFNRTKADWIENREQLDAIWRQRVKNDWLGLKLAEREVDDIRDTLLKRYASIGKRVGEFDGNDVFQFFMNAFATSIEPHSSYMSPRLAENFEISMKLSLDGIGALLSSDGEYVEVQEVVTGGPADMDGRLKAGDRIIGVAQADADVVDVVGWRLDDVVDLIRGERETRVRLEILPAETGLKGTSTILELVRNEVKLEEQAAKSSVETIETEAGPRKIGIIDVPVFYVDFRGRARNEPNYRSSTRDVRRLINDLRGQDIDGLVIDLRGNGGGALVEATTMTGLFIDEGPVVQIRDARGRVSIETDNEPGMAWDGPLAVLVNRSSASASEIFAAAIQDYGRGIILGEPTFGKGTVQNLFNLDNYVTDKDKQLGQLKLTMAKFFRINGGSTQERGVVPDILLPSYGDPAEYGESSLDYAMAWSSIDSLEFKPLADLSPLLPHATTLHLARRDNDEIRALIEDFERYDELADRISVSLLESERRRQQDEAEQRRIARFGEDPDVSTTADSPSDSADSADPGNNNASTDDGDEDADSPHGSGSDVLRTEAARILADLIELDRDQHRLVQVQAIRLEGGLN